MGKNIFKILKIAMVLLLIAGTVCLFIFGIGEKKSDIEQAFLTTGTIENLYNVKAHIIRDEHGITAGFSGKMLSAVNDGDRVAAGATIGYIVKPEYEQELIKLRQVDDKISAVQNAASYVESQHTELGFMNEQINNLTDKLAGMCRTEKEEYEKRVAEQERLIVQMNEKNGGVCRCFVGHAKVTSSVCDGCDAWFAGDGFACGRFGGAGGGSDLSGIGFPAGAGRGSYGSGCAVTDRMLCVHIHW